MKTSSSRIRGFTLLELLVVVLIIGIITAFVVPAAHTIVKGSQLTQASQVLVDQLKLARQYALSTNHPVEVRLIRYADPEVPGEVLNGVSTPTTGNYRAVQILQTTDAVDALGNPLTLVALDKPQVFPQSVIMNPQKFSTVISPTEVKIYTSAANPQFTPTHVMAPTVNDPKMPRNIGLNYDYIAFRFMPDGSTNLPAKSISDANGAWFITLHGLTDQQNGATPPLNFFTVQIDPVSGTVKEFHPGI